MATELPTIDVSAPPVPPDTARSDTGAASDSDAASRDTPDIRPPRDTGIEWPLQGRRPNPYPSFIPSPGGRRPSEWGTDDHHLIGFRNYPGMPPPSPYIPQPYQANQIIQQVGGFFKQFGSNQSQIYAAAMLGARGNFLKGLLAGQTAAANAQLKLYELNAVRLAEEEKQRAYKYGEIFTLYGDNKDPSLLFRKLTEAAQGHDDGMMAAIASSKVETIKKLIDYRDTHNDALLKLNEMRTKIAAEREKIEKERTENEQRKEWFAPPSAAPATTGAAPGTPPATPLTGGAPATGAPGEAPATAPSRYALPPANALVDQAARDRFMDRSHHVPQFAEGPVTARQAQIEKVMDAIEADPTLTDRPSVVNAVRGVMAEMGQQLESYLDGKPILTGRDTTKGHWGRILRLAEKTGSDVGPETGRTRAATERDFASGADGRILSSIGTAYRHIHALRESLDKGIPGGTASVITGIPYVSRYLGPRVVSEQERRQAGDLDNRVTTAVSEYERALIGGKPTQTGREHAERLANWRQYDVVQIKGDLDAMEEQLRARLQEQKDRYVAGTRGKPSDMIVLFDRNLGKTDPEAVAGLHAMESAAPSNAGKPTPSGGPTAPRVRQGGHTFERQPDGSYKAID